MSTTLTSMFAHIRSVPAWYIQIPLTLAVVCLFISLSIKRRHEYKIADKLDQKKKLRNKLILSLFFAIILMTFAIHQIVDLIHDFRTNTVNWHLIRRSADKNW